MLLNMFLFGSCILASWFFNHKFILYILIIIFPGTLTNKHFPNIQYIYKNYLP